MRGLLRRIFTKGTFASNVATLSSGTAIGQISVILAAPLLSRLFTPSDFGQLQFILSSALILATFSTFRYEMSIPLPKEDDDAFRLVKLSIGLATITALIVLSFIVLAHLFEYSAVWWQNYSNLAYFIPLLLIIEAGNATLGYWFMRKSDYRSPSAAKAISGLGIVSFQLILHLSTIIGGFGLVLGQNIGQLVGLSFLFKRLDNKNHIDSWRENWQRTLVLARKYKDFPLFASWNAGLNTLARHLPPIMLTWYFNPELVGYYAIGMRLLNIPLNMVSMSVGQVFFQQISRYVKNEVPIFPFLRSTGYKLFLIGFPGLLSIFLFGPAMFQFVFGENWGMAGEIASVLAPYFFIRFIASPLSPIFALVGKQYLSLIWQSVYTMLTFAVLYWGPQSLGFIEVVWLYSILSAIMFLIFLGMEMVTSYLFDRDVKTSINSARFN